MCTVQKLAPQTARLLHSTQSISSVHDVVKELVENSLDSGGTNITVKLADFGYEKIEVCDNGCGISKSDLPQVVLPHYTSKITGFDDLHSLRTYGFRGQGLAVIAALSEVTIASKCQTEDVGHSFTFDHQCRVITQEALPFEGTAVTVKQLFKNVPVRRKHLSTPKNKATGLKKVERMLSALGIAWPGVRLCLYHDKSLVWKKIPVQTFGEAVGQVFGMTALNRMEYSEVQDNENNVTIQACLPKSESGTGELSSSDPDRMVILINRRHVAVREINQAIQKKYAEATGTSDLRKYPACAVRIDVPPEDIDVNYEPNKMVVVLVKQDAVLRLLDSLLDKVYGQPRTNRRADKENQHAAVTRRDVSSQPVPNRTGAINRTSASSVGHEDGHSLSCGHLDMAPDSNSTLDPREDRATTSDSVLPAVQPSHLPTASALISTTAAAPTSAPSSDHPVDPAPPQSSTRPQSALTIVPSEYSGWFRSPARRQQSPAKLAGETPTRRAHLRSRSPFTEGVSPGRQLQFRTSKTGLSWSLGLMENSQGKAIEPPVRVASASKRPSTSPAGPITPTKRLTRDPHCRRILDLIPRDKSPIEVYSGQRKEQILSQDPGINVEELAALIQDEWNTLTPAEQQQYDKRCRGSSSGSSETTARSTNGKQTMENRPSAEAQKSKCSSRKKITASFSLDSVIQGFEPYCALTQTFPKQDDGIAIIGYLSEAGGWLICRGTTIYALNAFRLKEAILFKRLVDSYALPMDHVYPPIEVDQSSLGKADLWKSLAGLQKGSCDFTGASYITDPLLLSNGFEVRFPSGSLDGRAEIVQKASSVGLNELKEILAKVLEHSGGCSLRQSRPAKTLFYLQGEAARMVQGGPPKISLIELQELMEQSRTAIDDKCIHARLVCTELFDFSTFA